MRYRTCGCHGRLSRPLATAPEWLLIAKLQFHKSDNPWLRLTTSATATFPNPIIDFTKKLRFDIYCDKPIKVAVGCRETTSPGGTTIGSDGGTSGGIEWAGVTNIAGTAPMPTRSSAASNWTALTFDFPVEPIRNFSSGNGVLSTASGLGVLEHIAIVPAAGSACTKCTWTIRSPHAAQSHLQPRCRRARRGGH